jgi:class 3 adenylate cyclase/tetratricopeptide (TPR) repeat protein
VNTCVHCDRPAPTEARFCPSCGTRLQAPAELPAERKIVTIVFADLVGFTALCEQFDPEDIDTALRAFFHMARSAIERFGGTVEKFIGDAVVGLFGVPIAHEDDPERGVRAALEITARMPDLPSLDHVSLGVRAAVNTGPALVRLSARGETGEGVLVGDSVNTAARLLAETPPMAVVCGARTKQLTDRSISYEAIAPCRAKGKADLVQRWLAKGAVSRRGVKVPRSGEAPFVGREIELGMLSGLLEKAIASRSPQYALIIGEAGIGKSRLVRQLFHIVDQDPGLLCTWRQGHCTPYGDGVAFQALREIVAAHAGILHTDPPSIVEARLERAVGDDAADEWFMSQMRPLVGLSSTRMDRESTFAAWQRFIEGIARVRPAIVVLEDLQWARESTLDFLEHLSRSAREVPLLILGTARPELVGSEAVLPANVTRIDLKSLDEEETARLTRHLAGPEAPPLLDDVIAERSGGNPLFIEELVRYLRAAPQDDGPPGWEVRDAPGTPDSILLLIGARLDALPPDHKALLADASVVGAVFWPEALRHLGDRDAATVGTILDQLEEREFVRRLDASTVRGSADYTFWHALTQDVAYDRLPRALRASKHAATAEWMRSVAGDGATDLTQIIAYHYATAMELATAARENELANRVRPEAVLALESAGEKSLGLDVRAAESLFARAVTLAGEGHERHPYLLVEWANALRQEGKLREAAAVLDDAITELTELGDGRAARAAAGSRWYTHWLLADGREVALDAPDIPGADVPTVDLVEVLYVRASRALYAGQSLDGLRLLDRMISVSEQLALPEPMEAFSTRGSARRDLGDAGGIEDHRRALEMAKARGVGHSCCAFYANLGEYMCPYEGPAAALAVHEAGLELARTRHDEMAECFCRAVRFLDLVLAGMWDEAAAEAPRLDEYLEAREDIWDLQLVRATAGLLHVWRGDAGAADDMTAWAEERSRSSPIASTRFTCLATRAVTLAALGRETDARSALAACADLQHAVHMNDSALRMPEVLRLCSALGQPERAQTLASALTPSRPYDGGSLALLDGVVQYHEGHHREAAVAFASAEDRWARLGVPYEQGLALLWLGRSLASLADRDAAAPLEKAVEILTALGARPAVEQAVAELASLSP